MFSRAAYLEKNNVSLSEADSNRLLGRSEQRLVSHLLFTNLPTYGPEAHAYLYFSSVFVFCFGPPSCFRQNISTRMTKVPGLTLGVATKQKSEKKRAFQPCFLPSVELEKSFEKGAATNNWLFQSEESKLIPMWASDEVESLRVAAVITGQQRARMNEAVK